VGGLIDGAVIDRQEFEKAVDFVMKSFEWESPGLREDGPVSTAVEALTVLAAELLKGVKL
jgi:hypothetical protein